MKLLLITKTHVAVYQDRQEIALYEVNWSLESDPQQLVKELLE